MRGRKFVGQMAELKIFNHPLDERQIIKCFDDNRYNTSANNIAKYKWLYGDAIRNTERNNGFTKESRVVFDPDILWATSKKATDTILKKVKAAGFNTYIPYVWHGKGAYYLSEVSHTDERLATLLDGTYDPLKYLISKAHSMGIEVHPCLVVARREDDRYPQFYDSGTPKNAYNVHNKKFRKFIHDLLMEVVTNYDVDGVNLDYIRTMGVCNSSFCRKNYFEEMSANFRSDYYLRYVITDARKRIQAWQDNAITDIVKKFSISAKRVKPEIIISVDAHPVPTGERRPLNGRDAVKWSNDNLIDVVFSMDYRKKIDFDKADRVYRSLKNKKSFIPLFASYDLVNSRAVKRRGDLMAKYVAFSRKKWPEGGYAVYLLHQMSEEQVTSLGKGPFSQPVETSWH